MVWRYVRRFVERDAREALHYVCCAPLSADQPGDGGQAQLETAWALVRRIIAQAAPGAAWEELVGGFRPDGTRFPGIVEQGAPLLALADARAFHAEILARAAADAEDAGRVSAAVKLYDLAGEPGIVVGVLARALGAAPGGDAELERTARDVLRNYERTNRAPGRERDAVSRLLQVREAAAARDAGRPDVALALMERTGLVPLDGDVARVARRADEVAGLHDALQRNLPAYLTLTMDLVADMYARVKAARGTDNATLVVRTRARRRDETLTTDLADARLAPPEVTLAARVRGCAQVPDGAGRVCAPCAAGCGDLSVSGRMQCLIRSTSVYMVYAVNTLQRSKVKGSTIPCKNLLSV
jgi:nuclear pore complex protein Nup93